MRARIVVFLMLLLSGIWVVCAEAKIARGGGGGGMRSGVANRSAPSRANVSRSDVNRQNVQRGNIDRNVNVNNVNVNRNVDIDRDVDVNGWGGGRYYDDPDWGWGAFAAGATVGAIGAAAAYDEPDTVVIAPSSGGYVSTLPSGCTTVVLGGANVYDCGGVYYQPSYQGSSLMYQQVQP